MRGDISLETFQLGFATLKSLRVAQMTGMGRRKTLQQVIPRLPYNFDERYERKIPQNVRIKVSPFEQNTALIRNSLEIESRKQFRVKADAISEGCFRVWNESIKIGDESSINWSPDEFNELPHLADLKLKVLEPLYWAIMGYEPQHPDRQDVQQPYKNLLNDWVNQSVIGRKGYLRSAWAPWVVSRRIQHLLRYLGWVREGDQGSTKEEMERLIAREIYKNSLFLRNHIEWDVDGNHLIENGTSLVMAGLALEPERADWVRYGINLLEQQMQSQTLADGCHYERSPMYHIIVLTRMLTVCDLLARFDRSVPNQIRTTTQQATDFLKYISHADGSIPLLNDSVHGEALTARECLRYASKVGFTPQSKGLKTANLAAVSNSSGYTWFENDVGKLLVDGGPVGPPHLPGHSHSDTLSILLWGEDTQVLTDTGTFGYIADEKRNYARGVRGHNTVQVGNTEPIEVGGKYLMGPRSNPEVRVEKGEISLFEGAYRAQPFNGPHYRHHRSIYTGPDWWLVRDTVDKHDRLPVKSRLHFHPNIELSRSGESGPLEINSEFDETGMTILPFCHDQLDRGTGPYFPRFGVEKDRDVVTMRISGNNRPPVSFGYWIADRWIDEEAHSLTWEGQRPEICSNGATVELPPCQLLEV